jgi:hypothetical protein
MYMSAVQTAEAHVEGLHDLLQGGGQTQKY